MSNAKLSWFLSTPKFFARCQIKMKYGSVDRDCISMFWAQDINREEAILSFLEDSCRIISG